MIFPDRGSSEIWDMHEMFAEYEPLKKAIGTERPAEDGAKLLGLAVRCLRVKVFAVI